VLVKSVPNRQIIADFSVSKPATVAGPKLNDTRKASYDAQQAEKSAAPPPAARYRPKSSQEKYEQTTYSGQEELQTSAVPAPAQTWNQEATSAPQQNREIEPARRVQVPSQKVTYPQPQGMILSKYWITADSNFLTEDPNLPRGRNRRDGPTSSHAQYPLKQDTSAREHLNIELQNKELRNQMKKNQEHLEGLQSKLKESEVARANLQQLFEEASETIFRLRPQRQECTESEIEDDYGKLIKSVQNWVDVNCGIFLDDGSRGFWEIGKQESEPGAEPQPFEKIISDIQSEAGHWVEAKGYMLEAVVMRYLIDRILHKPFSILLPDSQRDFLVAVEKSMGKMEPQKGELHVETKI
jgi:hypothetical protein